MSVSADKPRLAGKTGLWLALKRVVPLMFLCVLPIAVLAFAAAMFWHRGTLGIDFRGELYPEAKLILHGQNPFPAPDADLSGGVNRIFPVAAAALVSPLTVLPVGAAAAVFAFVLLAALGATLAVLGVRDLRVYGAVALWPSSIGAIQTGNLTILLGLLVALAWRWRNRMLLPGVAIGLAIVLKLFLWPLVVWLLAIRRYAAAVTAAGLAAVGTLLVLPFMPLRDYAHLMSNLGDTFGEESYNLVGLLQQSGLAGLSAAHLTATIVGLAVLAFAYRERSLPLALAASLVLSPIVWMNYFVLLAVPLAIARPRFGLVWLAPLVLVVCPGNRRGRTAPAHRHRAAPPRVRHRIRRALTPPDGSWAGARAPTHRTARARLETALRGLAVNPDRTRPRRAPHRIGFGRATRARASGRRCRRKELATLEYPRTAALRGVAEGFALVARRRVRHLRLRPSARGPERPPDFTCRHSRRLRGAAPFRPGRARRRGCGDTEEGTRGVPVDRPTSERDLSGRASACVLAVIVAGAVVARGFMAGDVQGIWILPDEWAYGNLAHSFAATGQFALRGTTTLAYSLGYPFLLAPAFLGRGPIAGYEAAKWLNTLLMSLAAVPVFLLARRLVPNWLALCCAALTLLIPSMVYTGVLMSENAFYPISLIVLLAFVRALEHPTAGRQVVALAAIGPAIAVRAQGVILLPVLLLSILLLSSAGASRRRDSYARDVVRELGRFRVTWLFMPLALIAIVAGEAIAGRSPTALLGRYSGSLNTYPIGPTMRWAVYQVVDLELYLVVIPFVPAVIAATALLWRPGTERPRRSLAAVATAATAFFILAAAAASQAPQGAAANNSVPLPPNLHDRYCFYVAPLFLMFFFYWLRRRPEFSNRVLLPVLVVAATLPLVLPFASVHSNADFDALALLPWSNTLISGQNVHYAMALTALALCAILIPRRSTIAMLQVALVATLLWFVGLIAQHNVVAASVQIGSSRFQDRGWIDRTVSPGACASILWAPERGWSPGVTVRREQALWRTEFLNSSVANVFFLGRPMHFDLPQTRAQLRNGELLVPGGAEPAPCGYLITASAVFIDGQVLARDPKAGLTLYRLRHANPRGDADG